MNAVERVKQICKDRHIPIAKLERELGFGNGYVSQLRKGMMPADRLAKIASYLDVPVSSLLDFNETEKAPTREGERPNEPASADGLSEKLSKLSPALREQLVRFLALAKEDPDRAARFLEFAAKELESQR